MRRYQGWTLGFAIGLAAGACGGGGEPAGGDTASEWRFDLDSEVRTIEPTLAIDAERTLTVEPVLDLEVAGAVDEEPPFALAGDLAVGDDGRIYLLDVGMGASDIKVFGADGAPVGVIGRPGDGPGELSGANPAVTLAGDAVITIDAIKARFLIWSTDGEFRDGVAPLDRESIAGQAEEIAGLADGSFITAHEVPSPTGGQQLHFTRFAADGTELASFPAMPVEYTRALFAGRRAVLPVARGRAQMAVADDGSVYLTPGDEYQVVALDPAGDARWALRAPWPRGSFPDDEVDRAFDAVLEPMRAMGVEAEADHSSVENLPDRLPALAAIRVDGRGRLWVFPYERRDPADASGERRRPVDVYGADGERIFVGWIAERFVPTGGSSVWMAARGDHVYGIDVDPVTFDQRLVRHRLELPS